MKRRYYKVPDPVILALPDAKGVSLRVLIGQEDGAPGGNGPDQTHLRGEQKSPNFFASCPTESDVVV
jgi:hypothetical protein